MISVHRRIESPGGAGKGQGAHHTAQQRAAAQGQATRQQISRQARRRARKHCANQARLSTVHGGTNDKILAHPGVDSGRFSGVQPVQRQQLAGGRCDAQIQPLNQPTHGLVLALLRCRSAQARGLQGCVEQRLVI